MYWGSLHKIVIILARSLSFILLIANSSHDSYNHIESCNPKVGSNTICNEHSKGSQI